jgi:hypothetical protein
LHVVEKRLELFFLFPIRARSLDRAWGVLPGSVVGNVAALKLDPNFLLDELTDQPIDGDCDLIIRNLRLVAFFESGFLTCGPLIAFAVAKALWRDLASPLFPRWMFQRGLEHILEFSGEI